VPFGGRGIDAAEDEPRGAVHQDRDGAEFFTDGDAGSFHGGFIRDVDRLVEDAERGEFAVGVGLEVERSDAAAFFDEAHDGRVTEVAEAAGDERDFSGEAFHGRMATARMGEPSRPWKLSGKPENVKRSGSWSRLVRPSTTTTSASLARRM